MPFGVLAAAAPGTLDRRVIMAFAVLGFSVPVFIVGYVLIWVFAIELRLAAGAGLRALARGLRPCLRTLSCPLALGLV